MLIKNTSLALAVFLPAPTPALEAGTLTTAALALVTGANSVGASLSAPATGEGWGGRKTIRPPPSVPGVKEADLGVLKTEQRRVVECPTECDDGFVGYCAGTPIDPDNTCKNDVTGDQECCSGYSYPWVCMGFTGCVKKDGSCAGPSACRSASMPTVEGSCTATYSCYLTYVEGKMENSCNDSHSCSKLGRGGNVETLISSCNDHKACYFAGSGGQVEMFINSCNSYQACYRLGCSGGEVGAVTKSCNRDKACYKLAEGASFAYMDGGSIKSITKTCNNDEHKPCRVLSRIGTVGHLTKFTHTDVGEKFKRDSIGSIEECNAQCVNDSECRGIKWKEHSGIPCRFFGGEISENKCNGRNVCITV